MPTLINTDKQTSSTKFYSLINIHMQVCMMHMYNTVFDKILRNTNVLSLILLQPHSTDTSIHLWEMIFPMDTFP